jgi:hypothetical protein
VAEAAFQLGAVVPGGLRQREREGVAQVVRGERAELPGRVTGDLEVVQAADLRDDGVDRPG